MILSFTVIILSYTQHTRGSSKNIVYATQKDKWECSHKNKLQKEFFYIVCRKMTDIGICKEIESYNITFDFRVLNPAQMNL